MKQKREYLGLALKGALMGAANVIPGVSGGTVAFVTGIYQELIQSIKNCDWQAIQLLFKGDLKGLANRIQLDFLAAVFGGVFLSVLSLAKILEYLFVEHETLTLSFFFGLILMSIFSVGKKVGKWSPATIGCLVMGACMAAGIAFLKPADENDGALFIFFCGIVAISSMILPGLSGSYVLLVMGNYLLILKAVSDLEFRILVPLAAGCGIGLIAFSHALVYVLKKWYHLTVSLLTGFVIGSLMIIWPWKVPLYLKDESGQLILKRGTEKVVMGYHWEWPSPTSETAIALLLLTLGSGLVWWIGRFDSVKESSKP